MFHASIGFATPSWAGCAVPVQGATGRPQRVGPDTAGAMTSDCCSFAMKTLSVLMPMMITVTLFALAVINVLTKKTATIAGVIFTIAFFIVFEVDRKSTRLNSSHLGISYAVFCLKKH